MHKTAEYGIAAHWKYKAGALAPKLSWLESMQYVNENPLDFYELAKNDLYSEEVVVYSPRGKTFTLPRGATALDFAFTVHSDVGLKATEAYVNRVKRPLLTELNTGDMVQIETGNEVIIRSSWLEALKTSKARTLMRHVCNHRNRELDRLSALSMLSFCLGEESVPLEQWLKQRGYEESVLKVPKENKLLDEIITRYYKEKHKQGLIFGLGASRPKHYRMENLEIVSPKAISAVDFEHCCHPKYGDQILVFYHKKGHCTLHHKFCENAYRQLKNGETALKANWVGEAAQLYKIVVNLENKRGALLAFLSFLAKRDVGITTLSLGQGIENLPSWCEIVAVLPTLPLAKLRDAIDKRFGLVAFTPAQDTYKPIN